MGVLDFSFSFVVNGNPEFQLSWSGKRGIANDQELDLDGSRLSIGDIAETAVRDKRLILVLRDGTAIPEPLRPRIADGCALVLQVNSGDPLELERHLDRRLSLLEAERHRTELEVAGRGHEYRSAACGCCGATVDLSDFPRSPQVFCRFCESVQRAEGGIVSQGRDYRVCDECGFFGRVQQYTVFHFYFLIVVYGWRSRSPHLCDTCARSTLWKALLANLVFVLGVPLAIWGLIRAYTGGDPAFASLAAANRLALKGRFQEADGLYRQHSGGGALHPGVAMNRALGHLHGQDPGGAVEALGESLSACSNYLPALRWMLRLQAASQQGGGQGEG